MAIKVSSTFELAAQTHSGFSAEQILSRGGFYELGRRTNATAWSKGDEPSVIRISEDAEGSAAYFSLAQKMEGNPYMPIVFDHKILPSKDHIAHVERLENPAQKHILPRFLQLRSDLRSGKTVSEADVKWYEDTGYAALMTDSISKFLSSPNFYLDIDSLPEPSAFREAAIAITELSADMHKANPHKYIPIPDMNHTNIMWRRLESGMQPVLYDPIGIMMAGKSEEIAHAAVLRQKLGMQPASLS